MLLRYSPYDNDRGKLCSRLTPSIFNLSNGLIKYEITSRNIYCKGKV